jgi:hypothetical protein
LSFMASQPIARFNSTHAASNGNCWKCGGVAHSPSSLGINRCFCALCGVVQPSKKHTLNHFDLFQLYLIVLLLIQGGPIQFLTSLFVQQSSCI